MPGNPKYQHGVVQRKVFHLFIFQSSNIRRQIKYLKIPGFEFGPLIIDVIAGIAVVGEAGSEVQLCG